MAAWIGRGIVILLILRASAAPVALRARSASDAHISPVLRVCSWPVTSPKATPDRPDHPEAGDFNGLLIPPAPTIPPPGAWPRRGPLDRGREGPFARYHRRAADRPLR